MVQSSIGGEQQGLVGRKLAGINRVQQGEPTHLQRSQKMLRIAEDIPAGKGLEYLIKNLTWASHLSGETGSLVDQSELREAPEVQSHDRLAAAIAEDELLVGEGEIRVDVRWNLSARAPMAEHFFLRSIDFECVFFEVRHSPVVPISIILRRNAEGDGVKNVCLGMRKRRANTLPEA